jgi:LysR family glycine cleavage system transcriptional activator
MSIEAAIRGEGVALGRSALVAEDLIAGRLVALFPRTKMEVEWGYDLVYRMGNQDHPKVRALRNWIADEVRDFTAANFWIDPLLP